MRRAEGLARLDGAFDVLVIGGGATGLGVALDAASRGYTTALVTAGDFAQATSSRSTKLIHGGVRYLRRGDIKLVYEALHERATLLRNAPGLVQELRFLIPAYHWWQLPYYATGLKAYDVLAGRRNLSSSRPVSQRSAVSLAPTIRAAGLKGAIVYSDAQFNDSRMAIALVRAAHRHGAVLSNYVDVCDLVKERGRVAGAIGVDQETGRECRIRARTVVNAAGIFSDNIRRMDEPAAEPILTFSRGSHIVLDGAFLPGETAILIPHTDDRRVVFIIPWEGRTLVGTTDVPIDHAEMEPAPTEEEIAFLLHHAARFLDRTPRREHLLSAFAGLRPLVKASAGSTAQLSRDHTLLVSPDGLVTITGGKWTTFRLMARDAVNAAAESAGLPARACVTETLPLTRSGGGRGAWGSMDATQADIERYEAQHPGNLHPRLPYNTAMVAYAIENEMPVHLDDILSRRLRALLLDAAASTQAAPEVAQLMARLQGHDESWMRKELSRYGALAARYASDASPAVATI